jgi:hypothetical protein
VLAAAQAWMQAEARRATVPVWPEHWHAVVLFARMATQWQWLANGMAVQRVGLRYEAVPPLLDAVAQQVPPEHLQPPSELWRQLQVLEQAVLDVQAEGR